MKLILDDKDTTITYAVCSLCKHLISIDKATCQAFPGGIPDEIFLYGNEHTAPFPGDHGIQFEEKT